jgi:hypothetical protein
MRVWSEVPKRRTQEVVADLATIVWVLLWAFIGIQLYAALAQLSSVGTSIGDAGEGFESAGSSLEAILSQIPLVGEGAGNIVRDAFQGIGSPLVDAGADLERLLLIIASVLGLLLVAVAVVPWLNRYLPWRRRRLSELNAADRVIRQSASARTAEVADADVERVLATRALYRQDYEDLLEHTPDPIGDFIGGRYDRLAQAELESVGLRQPSTGDG